MTHEFCLHGNYAPPPLKMIFSKCMEGKISSLCPSKFLAETSPPVIKDINKRKNNQNFNNIYTFCILGSYLRKLSNSLKVKLWWPKSPPSTLSPPAKDEGCWMLREGSYGRLPGKSQEVRIWWLCRFRYVPSSLIRVSQGLIILFFLVQRGRDLCKWRFPLCKKKVTLAWFSKLLPCLPFIKNSPG